MIVVGLLLVAVFLLRLPSALVPRELNVDESQTLSLAMKSLVDPRPWQGIDNQSVGPLNCYLTAIFLLMRFKPGFILVHMLASALVCLQVLIAYMTLRRLASEKAAALGGLLMVLFYGLSTRMDYLHYAGELLPTLLLMVGFYLFLLWLDEAAEYRPEAQLCLLFFSGLTLGAAPWCKLQALPITGAVGLVILAAIFRTRVFSLKPSQRVMELVAFGCGGLLTSCIMLAVLAECGAIKDFWCSYILANLSYADRLSLARSLANFVVIFVVSPLHQLLLVALIGAGLLSCGSRNNRNWLTSIKQRWAAAGLLIYAGVALFAVCRPRYLWPHHAIFLVPPMTYVAALCVSYGMAGIRQRKQSPQRVKTGILLSLAGGALALYVTYGVEYVYMIRAIRQLSHTQAASTLRVPKAIPDWQRTNPSALTKLGRVASWIAPPQWLPPDTNERIFAVVRDIEKTRPVRGLAVWGWVPGVFVLTGIPPATRDPNVDHLIKEGPLQHYYRARYAADFRANPPDLFIDAVAPDAFPEWSAWTESDGYESDPELRKFIEDNYFLADELTLVKGAKPVRFFARRLPNNPEIVRPEKVATANRLAGG